MLPFFLGGFLVLGGCSVFGAGEPIQEINDEEATTFEDGFIYIYREETEEEKYLEQLEEAFGEVGEQLTLFNIREHADGSARISDYGLHNNRYAVASYDNGELVNQIKLDELNNEVDPDVIHRALVDFIEFNQE
jgi:hypothetical protein